MEATGEPGLPASLSSPYISTSTRFSSFIYISVTIILHVPQKFMKYVCWYLEKRVGGFDVEYKDEEDLWNNQPNTNSCTMSQITETKL